MMDRARVTTESPGFRRALAREKDEMKCERKGCRLPVVLVVSAYDSHWKRSWKGYYCEKHGRAYRNLEHLAGHVSFTVNGVQEQTVGVGARAAVHRFGDALEQLADE